ncbi:WxcM-like domain-containing protein [Muricauda sp. 2012CJ35-5]|uniref:WxcM-like domain-containing protein n=1 Tax=Flagellimonas spongiicola TaxID=2942208 RepID=A0ABT0PWK7_9FLAO|nr:WxcM-like domain-containing protein [Allomuricauda spongiicola]MCL6275541.1 WxcM-like domain-containing protein [Allomuricauda spongiicola]
MHNPKIINAETFGDQRGILRSFNHFDMQEVVRFYEIAPADVDMIRGWQAHKLEKKWFYCLEGSFIINLVLIDDFEIPSDDLKSQKFELDTSKGILCVPQGYATAIKATRNDSRLQIFSNFDLDSSVKDDYRFPLEKWSGDWQ